MKVFTGKVISKKDDKTAKVAVERVVIHPVYKKRFKRVKNYQVHDELGVNEGQSVKFVGSKPFSKTKKWKIIEVLEKDSDQKIKKMGKTGSKKTAEKVSVKLVKKLVRS